MKTKTDPRTGWQCRYQEGMWWISCPCGHWYYRTKYVCPACGWNRLSNRFHAAPSWNLYEERLVKLAGSCQ